MFSLLLGVNECYSSPCQNGAICNDEVNGYQCDCMEDFTDTHCQTRTYDDSMFCFKQVSYQLAFKY